MSVRELEPAAAEPPERYAPDTIAAQVRRDLASAQCADARERWLRLEQEVRNLDDERRDNQPDTLRARMTLRSRRSEAELEFRAAETKLREAGVMFGQLRARDDYAYRAASMNAMYEARDAEDRAREAASKRRGLLRRLRG